MPVPTVEIAPGVQMPLVGFGTWQITDQDVMDKVIDAAIASGYRYIDTAMGYHNHEMIAKSLDKALPKYGLTRKDIFIASKLSYKYHGDKAYEAGLKSIKELNTDYLDLFLIHFPGNYELDPKDPENARLRKDSWLALEKLKKEGKFRTIGVSNYQKWHLDEMASYATETPSVDQCEFHPHMIPTDILETCKKMGIHFQAYSSLGGTANKEKLFSDPVVNELAQKYGITKQDLLLAWAINQGISVLPKSTNPDNVKKNLKAADVKLDKDDITKLGSLGIVGRYCWDPSQVS